MRYLLIFWIIIISIQNTFAQKTWTLKECFDHAIQNNISVKQMQLSSELAANNLKQSHLNMYLPFINGNISENFNFGNSIDPTTYQFTNSTTNSTQFAINVNYNIFEGLSRIYSIKANKEKLNASEFEIEELKNNTKLTIANLYLQSLIANEVLVLAKENKTLTQNQLNQTKSLVNAGVLAKGALLDIEAQMAQNELTILTAENNVEKALNQLKLLLRLDPFEPFFIENLVFDETAEQFLENPKSIANNTYTLLPQMKSAEMRTKAAQYDLKSLKGNLYPTLSLSAYVGSNYFSASQEVSGYNTVSNPIDLTIGGNQYTVNFPSQQPIFSNKSFGNQLKDNLSENISINLSIPILGAWQRRTAISNAKLSVLQSELDIEQKQQQLSQDVFLAYTDYNLAVKKLQASEKNMQASNEAFNYANEKYKAGLLNALEFETSKNRKLSAQAEQVQAKYEYFFRKTILQYYKTGQLSFE